MADEDQQDSTARLEPPRLFGRKKGRKTPEAVPAPEPADAETTQVIEPAMEPVIEPEPDPEVDDTLVESPPVEAEPVASAPPPEEEPAPPLFADEVKAAAPAPAAKAVKEPEPAKEPKAPRPAKEPRPPREPLPGRIAAALTGLVVGLALVGTTAAALRGCEAVQNTATCGSAGFPLLLAIVVLMIVLGSVLLGRLHVPDPGSTSFLAVGLVSVVALLFLIEVIDHWSMVIAIPAVSVAAYLLSHWVTTTFIEPVE